MPIHFHDSTGSTLSVAMLHGSGLAISVSPSTGFVALAEDQTLALLYAIATGGKESLPNITPSSLGTATEDFGNEGRKLKYFHPTRDTFFGGMSGSSAEWQALLRDRQNSLKHKIADIAVAKTISKYLEEDQQEQALKKARKQVMRDVGYEYSEYKNLPREAQNMVDRIIASEGLTKNV